MIQKGLEATAPLWPEVERAYAWVHQAAHLLEKASGQTARTIQDDYYHLLAQIVGVGPDASPFLSEAASQFVKVTHSYGAGLFRCYEHPDLPRTNNDMEHYFGSWRYQERRMSGRKRTSASTVVRGSVRLMAAAVTRVCPMEAADLRPHSLPAWRALRSQLEKRRETRRQQRRFRHDPDAYLANIEEQFLKQTLPT